MRAARIRPADIGVPAEYCHGDDDADGADDADARRAKLPPYWRTSAMLSTMAGCVVPREMARALMRAIRTLHREADASARKRSPLDADSLFPILVWAMVRDRARIERDPPSLSRG